MLEDFNHSPWFIAPDRYDILVYPVEWIHEGFLNDREMREKCPSYYARAWGDSKVVCVPTVFIRESLGEWFAEGVNEGIRCANSPDVKCSILPSDTYIQLQAGKLKEMSPSLRISWQTYNVRPLIPSSVGAPKVHKMALGTPVPAENSISDLKSFLN